MTDDDLQQARGEAEEKYHKGVEANHRWLGELEAKYSLSYGALDEYRYDKGNA